jgi:tetraacyldisaccharide-1-P 4'-kinase
MVSHDFIRKLAEDDSSISRPVKWMFRPFLYVCSKFYLLGGWLDRRATESFIGRRDLGIPVISVGNITWGGTGKTPMTEFIASFYLKHGITPAVLTAVCAFRMTHIIRISAKMKHLNSSITYQKH